MISSLFGTTVPRVLLCSLICITTSLQAVFYQVELLKSPEGNPCCLIKDEHGRCNNDDVAQKQLDDFVAIIKKYKGKAQVVIEAKGKYCSIIPRQKINRDAEQNVVNGSIAVDLLCHLYDRLKEAGVSLVNIDHRILAEECLPGVFIKDILHNFDAALRMKELYSNEDGPILQKLYEEIINTMSKKQKSFIGELRSNSGKTLQALKNSKANEKDKKNFFENCFSFDSNLIDVHILHSIYKHRAKKIIFICAGGNHIDGVMRYLKQLNYVHLETIGNEPRYDDEFDVVDDQIIDVASIFDARLLSDRLTELLPGSKPKVRAGSKRSKGMALVNPQSPKKVKREQSASEATVVKPENQEAQHTSSAEQQVQPIPALPLQDSVRLLMETEALFNAGMASFRQQATMPGFQQPTQKL